MQKVAFSEKSGLWSQIKTARKITEFAHEIDVKRGMGWYFDLANEMRTLAKKVEDGKTP